MTDAAPPVGAAPPPGPAPIALALAHDLVTRYRLRLADSRDSRLTGLGSAYELAAASWTGSRAALVAFYDPPGDAAEAGRDLATRCEAARRWGQQRLQQQGAQVCDILLVALRPVSGAIVASPAAGENVRVGAAWVDVASGAADALLPIPPGLPPIAELRAKARAVREGAPVPTLAAVDLAERQTVAGGYVAPARRAMVTQPVVTYALLGVFVAVYLLERLMIPSNPNASTGADICDFGALVNFGGIAHCGDAATWWRYVSYAFVHDPQSIFHILFNGLAMFWIGRLVEQLYGRLVLLASFLATAVCGALVWILATKVGIASEGFTIGASGGISGLVGLLLMLGRVQGKSVPVGIAHAVRRYAITVIVLNVIFGFSGTLGFGFAGAGNLNNWVHLGGLLSGAALGAILPPLQSIGGRDLSPGERAALAAVIGAGAVALIFGAVNLIGAVTSGATSLGA